MKENFEKAYARVLVYEGGKADNPADPGGRTYRGITQRTYDRKRISLRQTKRDVWLASDDEIRLIYKEDYWDRIGGDFLPAGVDFVLFDCAVNSGIAQSAKWAQRAAGAPVDGDFGPTTRQKIDENEDNDLLIADILSRRLAMMKSLKTWKSFGKGWSARVANVQKIGQAWATGSVGPAPVNVSVEGGNAKALASDIKAPIVSVNAAQIAAATSGAAATVTEATDAIAPLADTFSWLKTAFVLLTVAGVGLAIFAKIAAARAEQHKEADRTAEVDETADESFEPVAVA